VNIFILDTGVRTTHQDFGGRAKSEADFASGSGQACGGKLDCAVDRQGHGTHCAGTAAGTTFGVAPKANVYGVKVLGDNGSGSFTAITGAIDWVASSNKRPAVASMSLGGQCPLGFCGLFGAITDAIDTAVSSGVTVVVAGGNSNSDACGFQPAFVPSAITVGSTDSTDTRSYFSNYGKCTDIWAPGSAITSASHEDDTGDKTFSGTSMACPHVAGGAALILQKNPKFKSEQVMEQLISNSGVNYITDLKDGDVNNMLYVAADAPPPAGPVEAPPAPECPGWCVLCWVDACQGCC
jgi:serine protease